MAMIKCPECGAEISDKAKTCIHCGTPILVDKKVKVRVPEVPGIWVKKSKITATVNGKVLLDKGCGNEVLTFSIDEPTKINFEVERWNGKVFSYDIEPGKRYQLICRIKNAFKCSLFFTEVDVIDSD